MRTMKSTLLVSTLLFAFGMFTGCESTDSGSTQVTSNVYYGVGFYDPWYHGDYHDDHNVIVTPPRGSSPGQGSHPIAPPPGPPPAEGLRPSHPIASPPDVAARPMPSIPSTPRVAPRGGGRR